MRRQSSLCLFPGFFNLLLLFQPQASYSQQVVCAAADSAVADTIDTHLALVAVQYHYFGRNLTTWPHEFNLSADDDFKAFRQIFTLYLADHVSSRFSNPEWKDILYGAGRCGLIWLWTIGPRVS